MGTGSGVARSCLTIQAGVVSDPHAHRSRPRKETICWKSQDVAYTLNFLDGWPFDEDADAGFRTISVPANGSSAKFTVKDTADTDKAYEYRVHPDDGEPRPNPDVTVDP